MPDLPRGGGETQFSARQKEEDENEERRRERELRFSLFWALSLQVASWDQRREFLEVGGDVSR